MEPLRHPSILADWQRDDGHLGLQRRRKIDAVSSFFYSFNLFSLLKAGEASVSEAQRVWEVIREPDLGGKRGRRVRNPAGCFRCFLLLFGGNQLNDGGTAGPKAEQNHTFPVPSRAGVRLLHCIHTDVLGSSDSVNTAHPRLRSGVPMRVLADQLARQYALAPRLCIPIELALSQRTLFGQHVAPDTFYS